MGLCQLYYTNLSMLIVALHIRDNYYYYYAWACTRIATSNKGTMALCLKTADRSTNTYSIISALNFPTLVLKSAPRKLHLLEFIRMNIHALFWNDVPGIYNQLTKNNANMHLKLS